MFDIMKVLILFEFDTDDYCIVGKNDTGRSLVLRLIVVESGSINTLAVSFLFLRC